MSNLTDEDQKLIQKRAKMYEYAWADIIAARSDANIPDSEFLKFVKIYERTKDSLLFILTGDFWFKASKHERKDMLAYRDCIDKSIALPSYAIGFSNLMNIFPLHDGGRELKSCSASYNMYLNELKNSNPSESIEKHMKKVIFFADIRISMRKCLSNVLWENASYEERVHLKHIENSVNLGLEIQKFAYDWLTSKVVEGIVSES